MASEADSQQLTGTERAVVELARQWMKESGTTVYLTGLQSGEMQINHDEGTLTRRTDVIRPQLSQALLDAGVIEARVNGRAAFDVIQGLHKNRTTALNVDTNQSAANAPEDATTDEPSPGSN